MKSLNDWFDKIICINMARREDRLLQAIDQSKRHNFVFERFEGHDMAHLGNHGCSASHRGVLELICHNGWKKTLILEDDFRVVYNNMTERFFDMIPEVPDDWDMLYLGAGYAEPPQFRIGTHVIRANHLKTTSSYAVTYAQARKMAPRIGGGDPIDEQYREFNQQDKTYIFTPRLMIQSEGYSDIEKLWNNHGMSMLDCSHERMV